MSTTNARVRSDSSAHFYTRDGEASHFVPRAKGGGNRPATVADCRKLGLLPSCTTILKTLAKPALIDWIVEQACLAVLTTPKYKAESLDEFVYRVLHVEKHQDQERNKAAEIGTDVHEALEKALSSEESEPWNAETSPFVFPILEQVTVMGRVMATEKILVGDGCAGKTDLILENDEVITVVDFKGTKKLPEKAWPEHRMQLAFYASALGNTGNKRVEAMNIYFSRTEPGQIAVCPLGDWSVDLKKFNLLKEYWYLANGVER